MHTVEPSFPLGPYSYLPSTEVSSLSIIIRSLTILVRIFDMKSRPLAKDTYANIYVNHSHHVAVH